MGPWEMRACQEVSRRWLQSSPVGSVSCPSCCSSSWDTALVEQKSTTCPFISALWVCSQDSSKAQSTEEPRALPVYGREKCRYVEWEKRCLSGEANREAGKFPGGSSRLANVFSRVPNSSAEVWLQQELLTDIAHGSIHLWHTNVVRGAACKLDYSFGKIFLLCIAKSWLFPLVTYSRETAPWGPCKSTTRVPSTMKSQRPAQVQVTVWKHEVLRKRQLAAWVW